MAAETLSSVSSALSQIFAPDLYRQWNRMAVTAALIPAKRGVGKNAAWDVEFSGATATTVAEGSDVSGGEYASDVNTPAILSWAHYRTSFMISETELDAAASSVGIPNALMDLFGERVFAGGAKLASAVNADIFTATGVDGSSNPTIVGLNQGPLETSGTYAGINRASFAEWNGNALANGGNARLLTLDLMYQLDQNIFTNSGEQYTHIVTSAGIHRKYAGLFEQIRRANAPSPTQLGDPAAMGTDGLYFKGIPIIRDRNCPAGFMFFLNMNYVETKYLPRVFNPQDAVVAQMKMVAGGSGDTVTNTTQIPMRIAVLAKTGDSVKVSMKTSLQMLVKRPQACGYLKDISEV